MKSIIRFSMKNGVALFLVVFSYCWGRCMLLKEINIEKYPSVDIPYLTVVIPYPGASPEQSMKEIGEPVEREFLNLDGVENVYTDGVANVVYQPSNLICLQIWRKQNKQSEQVIDKLQFT